MGSIWEGFGWDFGPLGASWAVLALLFFMLVFGMVFKSALGGIWAGFWVDFKESGTNFGRVLDRFWEEISSILAASGLFLLF